ncbi:hypothetical protein Enr8_28770 [Blastopirellula retiformator]|uniref:Uncharacterized protein n=1 Tax=Blastopirellula retiformator TaxID=2527970 RepID=A0A5C5V5K2_9BACT|nr:hypothetical protein Enr8_28770 [Blastopirellula retiformator]
MIAGRQNDDSQIDVNRIGTDAVGRHPWYRIDANSVRHIRTGFGADGRSNPVVLERFSDSCSVSGVGEASWSRRPKQANPQDSSMQVNADQRGRNQPQRYRWRKTALRKAIQSCRRKQTRQRSHRRRGCNASSISWRTRFAYPARDGALASTRCWGLFQESAISSPRRRLSFYYGKRVV